MQNNSNAIFQLKKIGVLFNRKEVQRKLLVLLAKSSKILTIRQAILSL